MTLSKKRDCFLVICVVVLNAVRKNILKIDEDQNFKSASTSATW